MTALLKGGLLGAGLALYLCGIALHHDQIKHALLLVLKGF